MRTTISRQHLLRKLTLCFMLVFLIGIMGLSASALSLTGKKLSPITYIPGEKMDNHYIIGGTEKQVRVALDSPIFKNVTISDVVNNEFDLFIYFPKDDFIPPGSYDFSLTVTEQPDGQAGAINTLTSVSKTFTVNVYSYEKDVQIGLAAPHINEGSNITFTLTVTSSGYPDIDAVRGKITVFDLQGTNVGEIVTQERPLPGLSTLTFTPSLDTQTLPPNTYNAQAVVFYDGMSKNTNATFLVGKMDASIRNYTSELTEGFNEFEAQVENNWGTALRNVYLILAVDGEELLQTPSIAIEPWQTSTLQGITRIDLKPGMHEGIITLFFEGEKKEVPVLLTVIPLAKDQSVNLANELQKARFQVLLLSGATLGFIFGALVLYVRRGRKKQLRAEEI